MKIELLNIPKEELLNRLKKIKKLGWIHTKRSKNDGAVGNTLEDFAFNNFLRGLINGKILVDFDARTGHNHGTKFRIKQNNWEVLFSKITELK